MAACEDTRAASGGGLADELMTRQDLAAALGVTPDTLSDWNARRVGPPSIRLGRRVVYRREAVRQWLVAREIGPVPGRRT